MEYALYFGLCFQIKDDLLDEPMENETPALSLVTALGRDKCEKRLTELLENSLVCLEHFGDKAELLRLLSHYIVERTE